MVLRLFPASLRIVLSFALLSAPIAGQSVPPPTIPGEPFAASVAELRAASAAVPVDPHHMAQILYEEGTYRVNADGTVLYRHRLVYRVDAQEAVKGWSGVSMGWDPWVDKPAELRARVLQPDGKFAELDQKTITDAPVKAEDAETFSSERTRRGPLPGMSVGAIVEEMETLEEKTAYFTAGTNRTFSFQANQPIAEVRLVVETPAAKPYREVVRGLPGVVKEKTEANGVRRAVYVAKNMPAEHESDVDLWTNEPTTPVVEFATGASWGTLAKEYAAIADAQAVESEAAAILPKDLPSDRGERIRAIVAKLHAEVRYTGVEFGAAKLTPQRPAEVIQRHYGDCKDKATLLVAMLRAAKIPASLAVLDAGPGRDVDPELPGMNLFDHAIVYVPEEAGNKATWIDATAEYFQPGTLPFGDTGRYALVISPGTTALIKTPIAQPMDSMLVESREFDMSAYGPAHVTEVSETHGRVDATYRSSYGETEDTIYRPQLEKYAQSAYLAKKLTKISHGDAKDLSEPFKLTLEMDEAKRGTTAMNEALVVLFPNYAENSMPRWFQTKPADVVPDASADAKREQQMEEEARAATYVFQPFVDERRVKIVAPDGFTLRSLPPDKVTHLGTATLTESYTKENGGVVRAVIRFDSGPGTLTAAQTLELREAMLELNKREYIGVYFDAPGAKALAEGHLRPALEANVALIAARPSDAMNHVRQSRMLLEARMGEEAQAEARKATVLDPKSSIAFATLGWALEFDALGTRFGKGYDRAGAIAAYKKAIELDPTDNDPRFDLAILYEFDAHGTRYAEDSDLPLAIAGYAELVDRVKNVDAAAEQQDRQNMMYAMLYAHRYAELDAILAKLPTNAANASLAIASAAAQHGAAAGIAQADKGNVSTTDRAKNLLTAGGMLATLGKYHEASEILNAGVSGSGDAAQTGRQVELYRNLQRATLTLRPESDPVRPVQAMTFEMLTDTFTRASLEKLLSRNSYATDAEFERNIDKMLSSGGFLREVAEKTGLSESVFVDLLAGTMTFTVTGDDKVGYAVTQQEVGNEPARYFVVKDAEGYRIAADQKDNIEVGNQVLHALARHDAAAAKALLDWKRDLTHRAGGDDPLDGPLLPRFWKVGSSREGADSPEAMKIAAISLLAGSMDAKPYLADLQDAAAKATGAQRKEDMDLLLAQVAIGAEQPDVAIAAAKRLLDAEPDSMEALSLLGTAYALAGHPKEWMAVLTPRVEKKPKDHDLLAEQARAYQFESDWAAARKAQQAVLDSGKATSNDYNSYAWMGLFDDHVGDAEVKAAQQSNMLSKNESFADLHTLACVYAAAGKTTEARTVLDAAMYAGNIRQPNAAVWYALGLLYEQYGVKGAALAAYRKVDAHEFDDHTFVDPAATYLLAQARIKALTAH
jgi:transglutaminase-like putative cysteine protease/tetratricopeptide (TPR) repeat protein